MSSVLEDLQTNRLIDLESGFDRKERNCPKKALKLEVWCLVFIVLK